jgi:hypothetical protein
MKNAVDIYKTKGKNYIIIVVAIFTLVLLSLDALNEYIEHDK